MECCCLWTLIYFSKSQLHCSPLSTVSLSLLLLGHHGHVINIVRPQIMKVKPVVGHTTVTGLLGRLDIGPATRMFTCDPRDDVPDTSSVCKVNWIGDLNVVGVKREMWCPYNHLILYGGVGHTTIIVRDVIILPDNVGKQEVSFACRARSKDTHQLPPSF